MSKRRANVKLPRILKKNSPQALPAPQDIALPANDGAPPKKPFKPRRLPQPHTLWTDDFSYFPVTYAMGSTLGLSRQSDEWKTNEHTRVRFVADETGKDKWMIRSHATMPEQGTHILSEGSSPLLGVFADMNRIETMQIMYELHMEATRIAKYNTAANVEFQAPPKQKKSPAVTGATVEERKATYKARKAQAEEKLLAAAIFAQLSPQEKAAVTRARNKDKAEKKKADRHAAYERGKERKKKQAIGALIDALKNNALSRAGLTPEEFKDMLPADRSIKMASADDIDEPGFDEAGDMERPLPHKAPHLIKRLAMAPYDFDYLASLDPVVQKDEFDASFPIPKMMTTAAIYRMSSYEISEMREEDAPESFGSTYAALDEDAGDGSRLVGDDSGDVPNIIASADVYNKDKGDYDDDDWGDDDSDDDDDDDYDYMAKEDRYKKNGKFDDLDEKILRRGLDEFTADVLVDASTNSLNLPMQFAAIRVTVSGLITGEKETKEKDDKAELKQKHQEDVWYLYSVERTGFIPMMIIYEPREKPPAVKTDEKPAEGQAPATEETKIETPEDIRLRQFKQMHRVARVLRNLENHDIRDVNKNDVYHNFVSNMYSLHWSHFMPLTRKALKATTGQPGTPDAP